MTMNRCVMNETLCLCSVNKEDRDAPDTDAPPVLCTIAVYITNRTPIVPHSLAFVCLLGGGGDASMPIKFDVEPAMPAIAT